MASSSRQDDSVFADFDNLRHSVKSNTVDRLKQIITGLNEENGVALSKTGKKQELIDRITTELDGYRYSRHADAWSRARAVLYQVRNTGMYTTNRSFTANHNFSLNSTHSSTYVPPRHPTSNLHPVNSYDPYAPPRRPFPGPAASPVRPTPSASVPIRFKSSPFYRIDQAVSSVVECPESTGTMDRRSQTLTFSLTQEQISKLTMPGAKYQLRLYCTTNTFYSPSLSGFRSNMSLCPIEFPATCEVRVNNTPLQANLKGIKKKPGTAPPADLGRLVRVGGGQQNRIEMIYVNSQQNATPKKFYLVVFLVEATSVDQLVDRLRKGKFRSAEDIKAQMVKSALEDDDIVVGKQKMTLKCPLSYTRINIPSRSAKCVHSQCFDAVSWYSVMEQTTTWLCPVCEKLLNPEELIVDGYFESILKQTPESVEEVEVEPDGEWHTSDNKFGSKNWMETQGKRDTSKTALALGMRSGNQTQVPSQARTDSTDQSLSSQPPDGVVVLDSDSDNEDETRVKRELSPPDSSSPIIATTNGNGSAAVAAKAVSSAVIDLTLDSDDEDGPAPNPSPLVPLSGSKRKASESQDMHEGVATYKKTRVDDVPGSGEKLTNGYVNRPSPVTSIPESHSPYLGLNLPPPTPRQMSSSSIGSGHHHHSPPTANSPIYYSTHLPPAPSPANQPRFISYAGPPYRQQTAGSTATNGSGMPYNGAAAEGSRHGAPPQYNPYLPRPNGSAGPRWP